MPLPKKFTLRDSAYALDGGTTCLMGTDEVGNKHTFMLVQSRFVKFNPRSGYIPGRLYFDDALVPIRSDRENQVLALLRSADIAYEAGTPTPNGEKITVSPKAFIFGDDIKQLMSRKPEENLRALLSQVVDRVSSPEFVTFSKTLDMGGASALKENEIANDTSQQN